MSTYRVNWNAEKGVLEVGFGEPAQNDQIVRDCEKACAAVKDQVMGKLIKVNGPASMPVSFVLAHALTHLGKAVAVWDPKIGDSGKYVVAISHDPQWKIGDLVD